MCDAKCCFDSHVSLNFRFLELFFLLSGRFLRCSLFSLDALLTSPKSAIRTSDTVAKTVGNSLTNER